MNGLEYISWESLSYGMYGIRSSPTGESSIVKGASLLDGDVVYKR
jgi:hypothetical protein